MIETFTRLQCIELQQQIEVLPKTERRARAGELEEIQRRLIALRAERRAQPQPAPKPKPRAVAPVEPSTEVEVIRLRRPSRAPSRPPEAVPQPREPRPFADLRQGISEATRRHR